VFGQIKQARGFRQFPMRGFDQVCAEWANRLHQSSQARKSLRLEEDRRPDLRLCRRQVGRSRR
jgi:hypothetical protein